MPAQTLIPGWEERAKQIHAAKIYGPRQYITKIYQPILEDLGLTRDELKAAGAPSDFVSISEREPGHLLVSGGGGVVIKGR